MHQAIPYRTWISSPSAPSDRRHSLSGDAAKFRPTSVRQAVADNAIVVFGRSGCCMCHVLRQLLLGHGVNPVVFEVEESDEAAVVDELASIVGAGGESRPQFPLVFVGGKMFGGLERVMSAHISGELVPILKDAGALWL